MYQSSGLSFSPICQGGNKEYHVENSHHFLFADALRDHDTYSWSSVSGQVSVLYWVVSELSPTFTVIIPCRLFTAHV